MTSQDRNFRLHQIATICDCALPFNIWMEDIESHIHGRRTEHESPLQGSVERLHALLGVERSSINTQLPPLFPSPYNFNLTRWFPIFLSCMTLTIGYIVRQMLNLDSRSSGSPAQCTSITSPQSSMRSALERWSLRSAASLTRNLKLACRNLLRS